MKKCDNTLNGYNKKMYVVITLLSCLFFALFMSFCAGKIFAVDNTEMVKSVDLVVYENKNPVDLDKILEENSAENIKHEMVVEELELEYMTKYSNNSSLAKRYGSGFSGGTSRNAKCDYYKKIQR